VKQLADQHEVGERTIRCDLEAMAKDELEPAPPIPEDLVTALASADTADALWKIERRLTSEAGAGRVSISDAEFFLRSCRELRQTLKEWKKEVPAGDFLSTHLKRDDGASTDGPVDPAEDQGRAPFSGPESASPPRPSSA
jgi:hypothetical protein